MKHTILVILSLFGQFIMAQNDAFIEEVITTNGKVYYEGKLFSGNLYEYKEEAQTPNKCISKSEFIDGVRHGASNYWYINGQPKSEANYENGKSIGIHTYYTDSGIVIQLNTFENGVLIKDEAFFSNGNPKYEKNYNIQGSPDGKFINWYENNQKNTEEHFVSGVQTKFKIKYTPTGKKVFEHTYKNGVKIASDLYFTSGNLQYHKEYDFETSKLTLDKTYFDTDAKDLFKQRSYKNEQSHGKQITKNDAGELVREEDYIHGKRLVLTEYANNKVFKIKEQINNFQTEKISVFNNDEQLITESFYTNGAKDSIWITYLPNGYKSSEVAYIADKKEWEGTYKNNRKDGTWSYYNTKSLNQVFETYAEGEKIDSKSFQKVHLLANRIRQKNTFAYLNTFTNEIIILAMDDSFSLDDYTKRVQFTLKRLFDTYFKPIETVSNEPYQLIDKFISVQNLRLSKKETIHERRKKPLDKNSGIIKEKGYDVFIFFQLSLTNRDDEELYNKEEKINKSDKIINSVFNAVTNTYAKSEGAAIESAFKSFKLKRFFRKNFKKAYKEHKK